MKIRILVVEDNDSLNRSMVKMLQKEGYLAKGCRTVADARGSLIDFSPDIVLLDIMLPGGYGYELIGWFRERADTSIIMVTALDDVESKEQSYTKGADDYITKPFSLDELVLKLNALRKRILKEQGKASIGDLVYCEDTRTLACNENEVTLPPSQAKLFRSLYRNYIDKLPLNKSGAFREPENSIDDSGRLQTLVARLRKNIEYLGSKEVEIETIYGIGYSLVVTEGDKSHDE